MIRAVVVMGFLLGAGAPGQTVSWKGPISGLIYDAPSRALRPLVGFPGASYLGAPIVSGIDAGSISPDGESAVVLENGQAFLVESLRSGAPRKSRLPDSVDRLDLVAWSPDSRAAVVCSFAGRRIQRLALGDPEAASEAPIDLSSLPGEIASLAANENAARIVVGVRDAERGGFYEVTGGRAALLMPLRSPGSAAFDRATGAFFAVDLETRKVVRVSGAGGSWEPLAFAGESEPLVEPLGLVVSKDGRFLYVAGAGDRAVRIYDLNSGSLLNEVQVSAVPDGIAELPAANSIFLLKSREKAGQPIWVLDARFAPSVYFIPAGE